MGREAIKQILARPEAVLLRVLVREQEQKLPLVKQLAKTANVELIWGDLTDYRSLEQGIKNADLVLHIGGLVSPLADNLPPEVVERVNVGGTANIIKAIKAVADPKHTRLVYIGTVAQTGSRNAPIHWGRTGDPIKISRYDHYAISKTKAEALVAESGLTHWVSLRQTGMAHDNIWKTFDPIMFHNPINGVFEWSTAKDSGRLAANFCADELPDELWRNFFNIGGGETSRVHNHEFMRECMAAIGVQDFRTLFKPNWFATQNFHGQWFSDSDKLEALLPFRSQSIHDFLRELPTKVPLYVRWAGRLVPGAISKRIEKLARAPGGSLYWFAQDQQEKIKAYFGSREQWEQIPQDWSQFEFEFPSTTPVKISHGYDETLEAEAWSNSDLSAAAEFRGGKFLSLVAPSPYQKVEWQCHRGHRFALSPNLVLKGGHWCPECQFAPENYDQLAQESEFFKQVWTQEVQQ